MSGLSIDLSDEVVDAIAERVLARLQPEEPQGFLDVAAAAEFIAAPKSRLYALVSARRIPFHKDGSRVLFDRSELRAWVRDGGGKRP